jgi:Ino eighty subunit 2
MTGQAETINRLLKKQSRPRNKRNTAQRDNNMDDVPLPASMAGTRTSSNTNSNSTYTPVGRKRGRKPAKPAENEEQEDGDDDDAMEGVEEDDREVGETEVRMPTMYRWVSSSRTQEGSAPTMGITFSVPISAIPPQPSPTELFDSSPRPPAPKSCAAPGCGNPMRYRAVKDWTQGACGIPCLEIVEAAIVAH